MKKPNNIAGIGIVTALASSLCCIAPLLALIAGSSGLASSFSWMEPLRPYLMGTTVLVLGYAWFLNLRPKKQADCDCDDQPKKPFMQRRSFLVIITLFAGLTMAFPYYSEVFYSSGQSEVPVNGKNTETFIAEVEGMSCSSCEHHVNDAISQLSGILSVETSYENGKTTVQFDKAVTNADSIMNAISSTGYKAKEIKP